MIQIGTIIGRMGRDPELKTTAGGLTIAKLSVAVDLWKKDQNGTYGNVTQWWTVTLFGKKAESLKLRKGMRVFAEGSIDLRLYDGRNGTAISCEMNANTIRGLDRFEQETDRAAPAQDAVTLPPAEEFDLGDLPF